MTNQLRAALRASAPGLVEPNVRTGVPSPLPRGASGPAGICRGARQRCAAPRTPARRSTQPDGSDRRATTGRPASTTHPGADREHGPAVQAARTRHRRACTAAAGGLRPETERPNWCANVPPATIQPDRPAAARPPPLWSTRPNRHHPDGRHSGGQAGAVRHRPRSSRYGLLRTVTDSRC